MADTAVGLFKDRFVADLVVEALREHGIATKDLRISAQPKSVLVKTSTSTPGVDFAAGLTLDLRSMGASEYEIDAYLDGTRHGNQVVFATGSWDQAYAAVTIMNQYGAIVLQEYAGATPGVSGVRPGDSALQPAVTKPGQVHVEGDGARLFTW